MILNLSYNNSVYNLKWSYLMKKLFKIIVPLVLVIAIIASIGWYLFVYDRNFTRDMLLQQARYNDMEGNTKLASWFYDLAYQHTGQDPNVAIELANQYKADGNYTKAEVTLVNAIADGATVELYTALSKTYIEQDKILDALTMLDSISNPTIRAQLDTLRPSAPTADPEPGFYSEYILVNLTSDSSTVYYTTTGEYPSVKKNTYTEPFTLGSGETTIYAVSVSASGLVSPLTVLNYTVGGVIEAVTLSDPAMDAAIRELLGADAEDVLYSDQLWNITEFSVPADAANLDDLVYLPYLRSLTVSGMKIDSLSPLSGLTQLEELDLTGCRIPDGGLAILAQLPALKDLTINNCGLSTIADLAGAPALTYLDLGNNTLRNLESLSDITTLTQIDLQHNAVTTLSALSSLTGLEKLNISYNSVSDLSPLSGCAKLNWLDAGNNSISRLTILDQLPDLTYLNLESNSLTDISLLANCTGLTYLDISNNTITYINSLSTLTALETFDFSYNEVVELPNLPSDCALYSINGSHNQIDNVWPLREMEHLAYVYLDYNKITNIDHLSTCYHLVMVNVYGNAISDVSALTKQSIIVNYDPTAAD